MPVEAACLALQPEHPTSSPLPRLPSPPAEPVRSRKPPPLVKAKASVATFDAAQQPLSCYVLQGRDYRADTLQVGTPALRLAVGRVVMVCVHMCEGKWRAEERAHALVAAPHSQVRPCFAGLMSCTPRFCVRQHAVRVFLPLLPTSSKLARRSGSKAGGASARGRAAWSRWTATPCSSPTCTACSRWAGIWAQCVALCCLLCVAQLLQASASFGVVEWLAAGERGPHGVEGLCATCWQVNIQRAVLQGLPHRAGVGCLAPRNPPLQGEPSVLEREAAGLQGRAALPKKEKRPPMQHQVGARAAPVSTCADSRPVGRHRNLSEPA
jgi:hypothetical protein